MAIRAQYSMEFMLVFAFSLLIVLPLISLMQSEYNQNREVLDVAQARQVLDEISITSQKTYYAGYPSRNTLQLFFPKGITLINSTNLQIGSARKAEIVMEVSRGATSDTLVSVVPFWINLSISTSSGNRRVLIKAEQDGIVNLTDVS